MTYRELYREGAGILDGSGSADPQTDARILLYAACGMRAEEYLLRMEETVPEAENAVARSFFARRAAGEPVQYITGSAPFYGHSFFVRPGVLIPRFDTERAVEEAIGRLPEGGTILDLCTGSGCILLSVLLERTDASGLGTDISDDALAVAGENARRFSVNGADFQKSDMFGAVSGKYDIIISNPPYIRTADVESLAAEVRSFEPRTALDGGADGLVFYRKIASGAAAHLKEHGFLIVETGYDQAEDVREIFAENGFSRIEVRKDYGGNDRVVIGERHV